MNVKEKFGKLLGAAISGRMNPSTLAHLIEKSPSTVSYYLNGKKFPQADTLEKILDVLDYDFMILPRRIDSNALHNIERALMAHPDLMKSDVEKIMWMVNNVVSTHEERAPNKFSQRGEAANGGGNHEDAS